MPKYLSLEKAFQRIGLFGGSFDPIHWGHVRGAQVAADELTLDQLAFLPALHPRHKSRQPLTSFPLRQKMLELCLPLDHRFRLCCVEEDARLSGATWDTVEELRRLGFTEDCCHLIWLMGSDSLLELDTWYRPEVLLEEIEVAVLPRPGYPPELAKRNFLEKVQVLHTPLIDVAARDLRSGLRALKDAVPLEVAQFIRQQGLYKIP